MKQKIMSDKPATKGDVQEGFKDLRQMFDDKLRNELKQYATKQDVTFALEKFRGSFKGEIEELLKQFRSDMYTRFDQIVNKFDQMREDQLFLSYDNKELKQMHADHEVRITTLEKKQKASH